MVCRVNLTATTRRGTRHRTACRYQNSVRDYKGKKALIGTRSEELLLLPGPEGALLTSSEELIVSELCSFSFPYFKVEAR
jgi:hypothetical protein